jgi:hypothetical protein
MFYVLKAIEISKIDVDTTRAPIANGAALKTKFKLGRKFSKAKIPKRINLNATSGILTSSE